ncbi:MAG: SDR family oxidoreductase [Gemmatimonadaceae bacterium]|nr:SDR family oxidoreductase [Chitinophagaceae bacterium]
MNIVITGASKGFGKSIAGRYASSGHHVFLCARNLDVLEETRDEMIAAWPDARVSIQAADLSKKEDILRFAEWIKKETGNIDILINNAGRFIPGSTFNEPEGTLEEMIDTNLYSAYHLTRALLPGMMKQKKGHIFNMCSIASIHAYTNGGAYSISKFALQGFSKNLREEMKPYNIKVTSVIPGAAYTDSWKGSGVDPKRIMEADDIADMIFASSMLSPQACVEDIILRPLAGDL